MNIGEKIRTERLKKNWHQEHVAKKLNVSRSTVSSWEVGRNYPDLETILLISDLFDISLDQLLREDKNMSKDNLEVKFNVKKVVDQFLALENNEVLRYYMKLSPSLPTQRKYLIEDFQKKAIGTIKRKRYSLGMYDLPRLFLKVENRDEVTIFKDMEQYKSIYKIDGENITLEGDFLGSHFLMLKNKKKIAIVSITKQQEEFSFDVNILEKELESLIISFIFLVALIYEEEKNVIRL